MGGKLISFHPPQIKALAPRQDSRRHFADFGCGKDEFHIFRRFFQRFQQGIKGTVRQHMHFVNNVDFIACRHCPIRRTFNNVTYIIDPCFAGRIHFHHVNMTSIGDINTGFAYITGLNLACAGFICVACAVQPLCDQPGG